VLHAISRNDEVAGGSNEVRVASGLIKKDALSIEPGLTLRHFSLATGF
jgi:hypothetical protein